MRAMKLSYIFFTVPTVSDIAIVNAFSSKLVLAFVSFHAYRVLYGNVFSADS